MIVFSEIHDYIIKFFTINFWKGVIEIAEDDNLGMGNCEVGLVRKQDVFK